MTYLPGTPARCRMDHRTVDGTVTRWAGLRPSARALAVWVAVAACVAPASAQLSSDDIAALRRQAEAEGWSFRIAENETTRRPLEELCGLVVPPDWREHARFDACRPRGDLPEAFDWRDHDGCTPIRYQGGCGSCWAFGAVGAVESFLKIVTGQSVDLSEQWLVSCTDAGSCSGGWHGEALDYMRCGGSMDPCWHSGAVLEDDFPYEAWDAPCSCPYPHPYCLPDWSFVGAEWGVPSIKQIKQAIFDHGPVAVGVAVGGAFHAYGGGVFDSCGASTINHSVVLVGWDDSQGDNGVWILRNSWGSWWGEDGYMRIQYGCAKVGFGAAFIDYPASDCNENGVADVCEVNCALLGGLCASEPECGTSPDCNDNLRPDQCDLDDGTSSDCNSNGLPDECDTASGTSEDCQPNSIPDECELADGSSADCQPNGIPDDCEPDCNGNGVPDDCDIRDGASYDLDESGVPDECEAPVLYVDPTAAGLGCGTSWTDAFHDLQDALAIADAGGAAQEIWVAAGVYTPDGGSGDRQATFRPAKGTTVYGGFAGDETSRAQRDPEVNLTILSGDLAGDDFSGGSTAENSYHVVTASGTLQSAGLDGLIITGGNADQTTSPHNSGAGIYNDGGEACLVGCRVLGNAATFGGGMYNRNATCPLVNCVFSGNSAEFGGAMLNEGSDPLLTNCTFGGNEAKYVGAGLCGLSGSEPVLTNCILWGNSVGTSQSEEAQLKGGTPVVNYCCVQNWSGELGGAGNIAADPLYADLDGPDDVAGTADDDLRPAAESPCVDAGDNSAAPPDATDLDADGDKTEPIPRDLVGGDRFVDALCTSDTGLADPEQPDSGVVDLGAYELPAGVPDGDEDGFVDCLDNCPEHANPDQADCDGDGTGDVCALALGLSEDCNTNGLPDECEEWVPAAVSACSLFSHGEAGAFCLDLLGEPGTASIEPRLGGVREVVVGMNVSADPATVTADHVQVSCAVSAYSGAVAAELEDAEGCGRSVVVLAFEPALPDRDCCTIGLAGMTSAYGQPADVTLAVRTLAGDVDRSGTVSSVDASSIKPYFGTPADATFFLYDIDASGTVSSVDASSIKPRFGNTAPDCP